MRITKITITTEFDDLIIAVSKGHGVMTGTLKEICPYCGQPDCYFDCDESQYNDDLETGDETDSRRDYNNAMNGIESLLLALACEGVDVSSQAFRNALQTATESCANNL